MTVAVYRRMGRTGHWKFIGCVTYQNAGALPFKIRIAYLKNWQHVHRDVWYKMHPDPKMAAVNQQAIAAWADFRPGYGAPEGFRPDMRRDPAEKRWYKDKRWPKTNRYSKSRSKHLQYSLF